MLISQIALAQSDANRMFHFCKSAIALLSGENLNGDRAIEAGICIGFIDGATNALYIGAIVGAEIKPGMNVQDELRRRKVPFACLRPGATSNGARAAIYVDYYSRNAKAIEALPEATSTSIAVFMRALVESSPCK